MSVVNSNFGFLKTASGEPTVLLENTMSGKLVDYQIRGKLTQDGTPKPTSPIMIESCGDYDEATGKYKIEFGTQKERTVVYLDNPLRRLGDYSDYIDFKNQRVVRNINCANILSGGVYPGSVGKTNPCFFSDWAASGKMRLVGTPILCTHDVQTMSAGALSGSGLNMWAHNQQASAQYIYWGLSYSFLSNYSDVTLGKESTSAELRAAFSTFVKAESEKGTPVVLYWVARYETYETLSFPCVSVKAGSDTFSVGTSINASEVTVEYLSKTP